MLGVLSHNSKGPRDGEHGGDWVRSCTGLREWALGTMSWYCHQVLDGPCMPKHPCMSPSALPSSPVNYAQNSLQLACTSTFPACKFPLNLAHVFSSLIPLQLSGWVTVLLVVVTTTPLCLSCCSPSGFIVTMLCLCTMISLIMYILLWTVNTLAV